MTKNANAKAWNLPVQWNGNRYSEASDVPPPDVLLTSNTFEDFANGATVSGISGNMTWGSAVNSTVSTTQAYAGSKSLRFRYVANGHWSEQKFTLDAHYTELTFKYKFFVPVNYEHRTSGTGYEGPNNKFFRLWGDPGYSSIEKVGASLYPGSSTANSDLSCEWDGTGAGMGQKTPLMTNFITPTDYGTWFDVVLYVKHESAAGANDGVFAVYKNGVALRNASMNNYNSTAGNAHAFRYGYLMGYANSAYTNQTDFFIDNFKIYSGDAR